MDKHKDLQHKALDYAGKGIPADEAIPLFGTDMLRSLVSKGYIYISEEHRPRIMLELQGARCLLDYEGLWNDGRLSRR